MVGGAGGGGGGSGRAGRGRRATAGPCCCRPRASVLERAVQRRVVGGRLHAVGDGEVDASLVDEVVAHWNENRLLEGL